MMYGDIYGKVKHITLENIVLSLPDGTMPITYNIEDFFYANPRNFSYGFNVTTEFSIDIQQLEMSRTEIPGMMSSAIREGLANEIYGHALKDVAVHLIKIESSFLEYQIIATFEGDAAGELYSIQRDIQRYAIEISERKNS